jgi:hypothetical protein
MLQNMQHLQTHWKKWIGETKGLKKSNAIAAKQEFEKNFKKK